MVWLFASNKNYLENGLLENQVSENSNLIWLAFQNMQFDCKIDDELEIESSLLNSWNIHKMNFSTVNFDSCSKIEVMDKFNSPDYRPKLARAK